MSCECAQCRQHYKTLGIAFGIPSESAIEEAYKEGVKQWHPDLYENYASLRADAEEHFKQIQIAYRELREHNTVAAEAPAEKATAQQQPQEETPAFSFVDAPGLLTAQHFAPQVEEMIAPHLGKLGLPQAIVDLGGSRSHTGNYSQFLLLAARGMMARDSRKIISLLWYADLGEIKLIERRMDGKTSSWQRLMGGISSSQPGCELQIYRSNGVLFQAIAGQADDSVKRAIYNFLMLQKPETRP